MARETVGEAFVAIRPDQAGFESSLKGMLAGAGSAASGEAKRTGKQIGDTVGGGVSTGMSTGVKAAGALLVGLGVKSFLGGVNAEARESQKVGAQTEAVLKSTGNAAQVSAGQISELSGALSKKAGIDDEVIQSGANMLLTFTNIRNEAGKGNDIFNQTVAATLDMAAGMAAASGGEVDLKSSSIQLGKALNDPIAGISALSRVGVTFTAQQKEQIKTLVESGNVLGAQKIILKEVMKEFGGSAAAQATEADKAAVAIGNFKESIGTILLPVLDKGAGALTGLANGFQALPKPVQEGLTYITLFGGGLLVAAKAAEVFGGAKAALTPLFDSVKKLGGEEGGFSTLLTKIPPAGLAVTGIAAAMFGAAYAAGYFDDGLNELGITAGDLANKSIPDVANEVRQLTKNYEEQIRTSARYTGGLDSEASKEGLHQARLAATSKLHEAFNKILAESPGQAQLFIEAVGQAGLKTEWYTTKLDEHTKVEGKAKRAADDHKTTVDLLSQGYDGNTTKILENLDALDKSLSKLDEMENKDLAAERAHRSLNDALDAQYNAFLAAAAAGGTNLEANKALEDQTLSTKEAILQDAQATRDAVGAHLGAGAGASAYRDRLVELGAQIQGPLHNYIMGLIADLDETTRHNPVIHIDYTEIGAAQAALDRLNAGLGSKPDQIIAGGGSAARAYSTPNPYSGVQSILDYLGSLPGHASGGWVEGSGNRDSVLSWLTPGEYVMSKAEVAASKAGGDHVHLHYERLPRNGVQVAVEAFHGLRAARQAAAL